MAVRPASAQDVRLNQVSPTLLEITGGNGPARWRLQYGTILDANSARAWMYKAALFTVSPDRVYFSHSQWLRLIDAREGVVIGRWRFPCPVVGVAPAGPRVDVHLQCGSDVGRLPLLTVPFDPDAPAVPYWPPGPPLVYQIPITEAAVYAAARQPLLSAYVTPSLFSFCTNGTPAAEQFRKRLSTREVLADAETAAGRDPLSPWLRLVVGMLMRSMSDPRASGVVDAAVDTPSLEFAELFQLSDYLERCGEPRAASRAFDRAYQDYWRRGNNPRMFSVLFERLLLYSPFGRLPPATSASHRDELIERLYRLAPVAEGTDLAWAMRADDLEKQGRLEEAQVWRLRGHDTERRSLFLLTAQTLIFVDILLRLVMAALAAALLLPLTLFVKYRPQRRLALAARTRRAGITRGFAFFNLEYWSRRERAALVCVVLAGWLASGVFGAYMRLMTRASSSIGLGMGSYAGPDAVRYFQNDVPASRERDLLLAIAYQQSGDQQKAEQLYRSLPAFAESWNNLGVILSDAGNEREARDAFEQALRLDPALTEAALNAGRGARDLWTELHLKYLPDRPMIAPPKRIHAWRAFLGESVGGLCLVALRGPFVSSARLDELLEAFRVEPFTGPILGLRAIVLGLFLFAPVVVLALVIPARDVTQAPGRTHWWWDVALPGASPSWAWLGGPALLMWAYLLIQAITRLKAHTANVITDIAMTGLPRAFGAATGFVPYEYINPAWPWVYGPLVLLFGVNLWLVLRSRRASGSTAV